MVAMDETTVVFTVVGIGVPLFIALILGIILFAGKARPVQGLGARAAAPGGQGTSGLWNAMILSGGAVGALGGTLGAKTGRFRVEQGTLSFIPDGTDQAEWSVPCDQITARAHTAFATKGVDLELPDGKLRCNVSREHINRYTRNSVKSLREARYYREFVDVLLANGARQG